MAEPPSKKRKAAETTTPSNGAATPSHDDDDSDRYSPDGMVTLVCDDGIFLVHASYLCCDSPFFRKALAGQKDKSNRTINLKLYDDFLHLKDYLDFIYGRGLSTKTITSTQSLQQSFCYRELVGQYILWQSVQNTKFQDAVRRELVRVAAFSDEQDPETLPSIDDVSSVYEETSSGDPLRKLFVDLHASPMSYRLSESIRNDGYGSLQVDFIADVVEAPQKKMRACCSAEDLRRPEFNANDYGL